MYSVNITPDMNNNNTQCIESEIFRMSKGKYALHMANLYGKTWLIILAILASLSLASVFFDIKWAVVFLMIIFLLAPALLILLYFFHGLQPVSSMNVVDHKITVSKNHIQSDSYQKKTDGNNGEDDFELIYSRIIPYSSMSTVITGLSSITIPLHGEYKGFIWFSTASFSSDDKFMKAVSMILQNIRTDLDPASETNHLYRTFKSI